MHLSLNSSQRWQLVLDIGLAHITMHTFGLYMDLGSIAIVWSISVMSETENIGGVLV